jgi:hypothetical protein
VGGNARTIDQFPRAEAAVAAGRVPSSPDALIRAILRNMAIVRGHVEGGRIVLDEPIDLPDGTEVEVAVVDDDDMTPEERRELEASIDVGLEQAARGERISAEEMLRRLRAI